MPTQKKATSFALSADGHEKLKALAKHNGITRTAMLELLIRQAHRAMLSDIEREQRFSG